jgi:hypothetical protein
MEDVSELECVVCGKPAEIVKDGEAYCGPHIPNVNMED